MTENDDCVALKNDDFGATSFSLGTQSKAWGSWIDTVRTARLLKRLTLKFLHR